jgi:hypothetical protein
LQYGTRLVWIFYPATRTVVVESPSGTQRLDIDGVLDGGDVLPGFKLPVRDIFDK